MDEIMLEKISGNLIRAHLKKNIRKISENNISSYNNTNQQNNDYNNTNMHNIQNNNINVNVMNAHNSITNNDQLAYKRKKTQTKKFFSLKFGDNQMNNFTTENQYNVNYLNNNASCNNSIANFFDQKQRENSYNQMNYQPIKNQRTVSNVNDY